LNKKRSTSDEPIIIDTSTPQAEKETTRQLIANLDILINKMAWDYKTNKLLLQTRDKAIFALTILAGTRISECLRLKKKQTLISLQKILLVNVETLKHGNLRDEIDLPKIGALAVLTNYVEDWLKYVPDNEAYIFPRGTNSEAKPFLWNQPLSRKRAFWIIKTQTKMFPHWGRAVCETIYGKVIFKDSYDLMQFMGLKRLDSTTPYVQSNWKNKRKRVNLL
jgi:hypothetical protein